MKGRLAIGEKVTGVSLRDSIWLVIALVFAAIPLIPMISLPIFACFTTANLLHLRGVRVGAVCPVWIRWAMLAFNLVCVHWTHGTFVGIEPGIAVFVALYCVKILEMRTRGEYQIVATLGYFLLLCNLFMTQELLPSLYTGAGFFLLTATLLYFHSTGQTRPGEKARWGLPWLAMGRLLGQTIPLVVLLFFLFPRLPQFGIQFFRQHTSGMTDRLAPGLVEEVREDPSLAFRVRFVSSAPPPPLPHYWRGVVLWKCEGLEWERGQTFTLPARYLPPEEQDRLIEQEIVIEAHGNHWLLAMDRPYVGPERSHLITGHYLVSRVPVNTRRMYRVFSGDLNEPLSKEERQAALQLPAGGIPARITELAQTFKGPHEAIVREAQAYFATNGYQYTLISGSYPGMNGWAMMETFLFERKRGYCSHYAASFSTLMRLAGVPARTVIGYAGGEHNPIGGFFSVYQSDAHAWSEVWLEDRGWVRIDPTLLVGQSGQGANPLRPTSPEEQAAAFETERAAAAKSPMFRRLGYQWAALNYQWTRWVLGYDRETQRALLQQMGMRSVLMITITLIGSLLLATGAIWLVLQWLEWRQQDPLLRTWNRFCAKVERATGLRRGVAQTPGQYRAVILAQRPDLAPLLEPFFDDFQRLQYAPWKVKEPREVAHHFHAAVGRLSIPNRPSPEGVVR